MPRLSATYATPESSADSAVTTNEWLSALCARSAERSARLTPAADLYEKAGPASGFPTPNIVQNESEREGSPPIPNITMFCVMRLASEAGQVAPSYNNSADYEGCFSATNQIASIVKSSLADHRFGPETIQANGLDGDGAKFRRDT